MTRSEYGFQLRIALLDAIAGDDPRCAHCRKSHELEDLEIDHVDGRTWYGRSLNFLDRIRRQWREYDAGVRLRALCKSCNSSLGTRQFRLQPRYA